MFTFPPYPLYLVALLAKLSHVTEDVLDYARQGWHRDRIAALFRLSSRDIQAALDYIQQHQEAVTANYQRIRDRQQNYQYPPEVEAQIVASRQRAQARLTAIKATYAGAPPLPSPQP